MSYLLGPAEKYEEIYDRDKFDKELLEVLQKALRAKEERPKEKHVRKALISTWREKGCSTLWKDIHHFPIMRAHVVCWKACFILHRMFRDGHPNVVKGSVSHMRFLGEVGKHWNESLAGYAPLISAYVRVIMTRVSFIVKNPEIPGKLSFEDKPYEVPTDADHVFSLSVEVFDLQSALLHFYSAVLSSVDLSQGPMSDPVQCHLVPLIPAIQDSATLYDLIFKLMKTLHAALPADVLQGHRERFNRQYTALRKNFILANRMKYLRSLVQVPILDPDPPSFLLPGQLIELELAKQVKLAAMNREDSITSFGTLIEPGEVERPQRVSSPRQPEPDPTPIPRPSPPKQRPKVQSQPPPATTTTTVFDSQFSSISSTQSFDFTHTVAPAPIKRRDDRDELIGQLMREIVELKEEIRSLKEQIEADHTLMSGLRSRLQQLEAELNDYKEIAEQTCSENVLLKRQIEASCTEQGAQSEMEARAKSSEEKFAKLRDVYHKLRSEHIVLLRTNGESQKQVQTVQKEKDDMEDRTSDFEKKVSSLMMELEEVKVHANDESAQVAFLRDEIRRKETESVQLEKAQKSLSEQLEAKSQGPAASHSLIESAVEEAENLIRKILAELDSPSMAGGTCTPALLLERTKSCLDAIDNSTANFSLYNNDPSSISKALCSLPSLSHCIGEVILQGVATSNMASAEDGKKLVENSKAIGLDSLKFLAVLKMEKPGSGKIASGANDLQKTIRALQRNATELVPEATTNGNEEGTIADLVDEELASTAQAVEAAALRIQQMLLKSREDDTGVKLEVNERLLDSCTGLMKAIKILIARSKELQSEIVGEGIGVHSDAAEFYKKNSRWSEGLISAAKQVGWGASVLVDAADKVVTGTGKYEELMVASHDIAASTAQLVAASRVKARPRSEKLKALKASSRDVTEATGQVVASAQSGSELSRQGSDGKFDYSKLSLTQAKRLEMESQVKALELEKDLRDERTRLAELRKVHYHLAGASEGWEVEDQSET